MSVILLTILIISDFIGALQFRTHIIASRKNKQNRWGKKGKQILNRSIEIIQTKSLLSASRLRSLTRSSVCTLIHFNFHPLSVIQFCKIDAGAADDAAAAADEKEVARKCQFHVSQWPKHSLSLPTVYRSCSYEC